MNKYTAIIIVIVASFFLGYFSLLYIQIKNVNSEPQIVYEEVESELAGASLSGTLTTKQKLATLLITDGLETITLSNSFYKSHTTEQLYQCLLYRVSKKGTYTVVDKDLYECRVTIQ